jgi:anaerobic magnesium-protoporphyrin IX monomethyl ester cyclase
MKILLINPPRYNEIIGNNPEIIEEERGYNPPLGLLYLAGYLEKNSGHEISVLDAQVEELSYAQLKQRIELVSPDLVGISSMTMTLIDVIKTAKIAKESTGAAIVLGGPHVHLFPQETMSSDWVDYLVLGEGEITFEKLLRNMDNLENLEKTPGIVFRRDGKAINTGPPALIDDLDALPFPARHLVPYKRYTSLLSKGGLVTTIITSRGCPYRCSFCDRPVLGKNFRARSPENVVDEIQQCVEMGISEFLVYDDTFTIDKKRVLEICRQIVERNLKIGWDIRARVNTVDEEMIIALREAGCVGIHYGVEAGTEKVLKELNKGITIDEAKKVFKLTKKHGIDVLAYFMIGNPSETREDILTTFRVAKMLKPDFIHMTILTPFPGTAVYLDGLKRGIIERDYWKEFAINPSPEFIPPHWGEFFSREELNLMLIEGYKTFYLRPLYILRRITEVRNLHELLKKAKAGFKVLLMKPKGV